MKNYTYILIFTLFLSLTAQYVSANNLQGLYGDNTNKLQTFSNQAKQKAFKFNNTPEHEEHYIPNYTQQSPMKTLTGNTTELMKEGNANHGQYATKNKLTNPIRINNPYNHLNDKKLPSPEQVKRSTVDYNGDAVRFKKGANGILYGYNKKGKKVGAYRVNQNGTTTQFDSQGNNMGSFK